MELEKNFYVTTPIYYVTAKPHLGSLYSTVIADVLARWNQLKGFNTFMLTGTDEHGQKIEQAAHAAGKTPKQFVDSFIPAYQDAWKAYNIEYSYFMRTTDTHHIEAVQELVRTLLRNGDIYSAQYEGWYCVPDETFITEKDLVGSADAPLCPSCNRAAEKISETTYFFRLSAYQDRLLKFYKQNPDFIIPKERAHEVVSFVESGLKDLSISRTTVRWGVPFPDNQEHVIYVWIEALCNYLTAVGYGQPLKQQEFARWWPAQVQVLGKDIIRFHGVYWPALLMAADLPMPKQLLVHGWIKMDKQKMSKSLGNVVDPMVLRDQVGAEQVRYYLMRQIPVNQDGEFSVADLKQRITSDLANDLGNLLQRMITLADKYEVHQVDPCAVWDSAALALRDEAFNCIEDFHLHMDECMFHIALARLWKFINKVNSYFHEKEPWKLAKSDHKQFMQVLSATSHSLRIIAILLWPVMPTKMSELLSALGITFHPSEHTLEDLELGSWHHRFVLRKVPILFEKHETQEDPQMIEQKEESYITIDDVIKVDLRVGTIIACQPVEKSDKLLKMQIDFGNELGQRQILGGIAQYYKPEQLISKQGLFIVNLKPRMMLGLESQGMMLLAKDGQGGMKIMNPEQSVPNGTKLQ